MSTKVAQFLHLACLVGVSPPFPHQLRYWCLYTLASLNFALPVSEYVATNVAAKPDTFLREPNPCYIVVFHMCSCKTVTVSRK